MIETNDDFHFIEFTGRNQLAGENAERELSNGNILLVPYLTNFITSSTELYARRFNVENMNKSRRTYFVAVCVLLLV